MDNPSYSLANVQAKITAGADFEASDLLGLNLSSVQTKVRKLSSIRVEDTFGELAAHTERTEKIASLHALAVAQVEQIKADIDYTEAQVYLSERQSIPKKSEKEIEAIQDTTPLLAVLRDIQVQAIGVRVYLDDMARAFDSRGTMLVNLRKLIEAESH